MAKKNNNLLDDLLSAAGNEYCGTIDEAKYIDTGSYPLNLLLSGNLYGGIPGNIITVFAGEEATGKTLFVLGILKRFLDDNPDGIGFYFESESAVTTKLMEKRGIDTTRVKILPVATVQEFRAQAIKILDKYNELEQQRPMVMMLDSLGMLSTTKEVEDTAAGSETKDMTRAALIKATFRVLTLKLGQSGVPLFVTNHTYVPMGQMYATQEMSGGSGIHYAASSIVFLSRKKEKDGNVVIGNIIHCKNKKSRLTRENTMIDSLITYDKGLSRYYGLLEIAVACGVFKEVSTQVELPGGKKTFKKTINKDPEKYFTKEILDEINEKAKPLFLYGSDIERELEEVSSDESEESEE